MADSSMPAIEPIDDFISTGFQQRFAAVFGCERCAFVQTHDKTRVISRLFEDGQDLEYPYAYFTIISVGANHDSYNPHPLGRRGMVLSVKENSSAANSSVYTVRVVPTNFEIEVNYVTNKFQSNEQGSIQAFTRRYLLARRFGYLKFSIKYGNLLFGISNTMPDTLSIPVLENIVEAETKYALTFNMTIHGYSSEPILGQQGKVNQLNVQAAVGAVQNGRIVATQSFTFDKS